MKITLNLRTLPTSFVPGVNTFDVAPEILVKELAEPSVSSTYPGEASGSISPATI